MLERLRNRRTIESPRTATTLAGATLAGTTGNGLVNVSHGVHTHDLPVAGMTVRAIRGRFADLLDLDEGGQVTLDGVEVNDEEIVQANQVLIFLKRLGAKGR